ncbi:hypothetical protein EXIGLDRAFT_725612 [Exidia glandulosa HHB12029]|uniref:DUF6534 domain-containing protein n=1 Tax=Exidia glandulosa HHB12029 TaxID=1314781 RepID=A0A165DYU5_EXIGL|nr:hypothetical protein EXIGLDRAFT_725612 [Exidia glandulosa HHB12029]
MEPLERPDITLTYGMIELGMALAMFLTGIATLQIWNYLSTYYKDSKFLMSTLLPLFASRCCANARYISVLDSVHTIFLLHASFHYLVKSFGDYEALNAVSWSIEASLIMNGFIAFAVQTYYCLRVHRLLKSNKIALFCWLLVVARLVLNLVEAATLVRSGQWSVTESFALKWQLPATLVIGAVSDIVIAASICTGLLRYRSGFASSDRLVDKLIAYTVGSGLLTAVMAIIEMILVRSSNSTGFSYIATVVFFVPFSAVAKLFNNSLLASLNEREHNRSLVSTRGARTSRVETRVTIELPQIRSTSGHGGSDLEPTPRVDRSRSLDDEMSKHDV